MIASNLRLVRTVWDKETKSLDVRARAARDEMTAALVQLSKQMIQGKRPYKKVKRVRNTKRGDIGSSYRVYSKAVSGFPPMNRTGKLRQSIRGERFNQGFAKYSAIVGPTIVYGRKVELGGRYWRAGTKFPYMAPAYAKFRTQVYPQIQAKFFRGLK